MKKTIDQKILHDAILFPDDVVEYIMTTKEKIIQNHVENVYPIKKFSNGKEYYYTKLTPQDHDHNKKISAKTEDALKDKIVAYYLGIQKSKTVRQVFEDAIEECTPQNQARLRQRFKRYYSDIADKKVSSLTEEDIRTSLKKIIKMGVTSKEYGQSLTIIRKVYFKSRYDHHQIINILDIVNEFDEVMLTSKQKSFTFKLKKPTDYALRKAEAAKLYRYCIEHPDVHNLCIAILLTTGLRIGELAAIEISDVDLEVGSVLICKRLVNLTKKVEENAKANSDRIVYLNDDALAAMKMLIDLPRNSDKLCVNPNTGKEINAGNTNERLRLIHKELEFNGRIRTNHDLRRTYASIQYLNDPDMLYIISRQLGHSSIQQTLDYIKDIVEVDERMKSIRKGSYLLGELKVNSNKNPTNAVSVGFSDDPDGN